jgi:hypothetical protein
VAVFLGDKYLSDDPARPDRWLLPAVTLPPDRYLVVWADGQGFQGNRHANFRLSAGGETLGLYGPAADGFAPIDTVSFGPQLPGVSYGRLPNGTGPWQALPFATPGGNNEWALGLTAADPGPIAWRVSPNPVSGPEIALLPPSGASGEWQALLFDALGRPLENWSFEVSGQSPVRLPWGNGALPRGQYWLFLRGETGRSVVLGVQR